MRVVLLVFILCLLAVGGVIHREYVEISKTPVNSWLEDQTADCAVVLTGSVGRVREGFDLLARRQIQKLIISGVHPGAKLREIFPQWPFYGSIQEKNVILEKQSRTTYGNATQSLALVRALQCRDIILVTSQLHMKRALSTFQSTFPTDYPIYPRTVLSGGYQKNFWGSFVEACKSFFYLFLMKS